MQQEMIMTTSSILAARADEIRRLVRHTLQNLIEVGRLLVDAKAMLPHGEWTAWLDREFAWSDRTARNYMNVARAFGDAKTETVSVLEKMPVKALYALAAMPQEDRDAAINASAIETTTRQENAIDKEMLNSLIADYCWHHRRDMFMPLHENRISQDDWEDLREEIVAHHVICRKEEREWFTEVLVYLLRQDGLEDFIPEIRERFSRRGVLVAPDTYIEYADFRKLPIPIYRVNKHREVTTEER